MAKINVSKIKAKLTRKKGLPVPSTKTKQKMSAPKNPTFGPVATINTAPVAIGNSMRGFETQVIHSASGARIVGRDYGFTPYATGTVTGWVIDGGMPLTPACMPTTALRNFVQMYNKFRINKITFHYITSSSTSTTGDVVFYYQKNGASAMVNWTSNSFLPYVLSDSRNILGPQWTNHSMELIPSKGFKSTDYGVDENQEMCSFGDLFLFSKTSSTESPGYVIMDYDITFQELSVNPRSGYLPTIKAQWAPFAFTAGTAVSKDATVACTVSTSGIGSTTYTAPSLVAGDVYKIVLDVTNSTFSTATAANLFEYVVGSTGVNFTLVDGFTFYALVITSTTFQLSTTLVNALTNSQSVDYQTTQTITGTILRGMLKLVGSNSGALQSAYS